MHDPLVVAWEIKLPVPLLASWGRPPENHRRLSLVRKRYHPFDGDPRFMDKPMHRPFRPEAWDLWVYGKKVRMRTFCTIWHKEPFGRDSGDVCSHWKQNKAGNRIVEVLPETHEPCGHHKLSYQISNSWKWHVFHVKWNLCTIRLGKDGFGISISPVTATAD